MALEHSPAYPEHGILFGTLAQQRSHIDSLVARAKQQHPQQFEGNTDSFLFELRYTPPFEQRFTELKRLQGTAAVHAGRRAAFRGCIVLELSSYLDHHEEDYLRRTLLFLVDMSDDWKYLFLIDDQKPKAARELAGKVLSIFLRDHLSCRVLPVRSVPSVTAQVAAICKDQGVLCSAPVRALLGELMEQRFQPDIISALVSDLAWSSGKRISVYALDSFLTEPDPSVRYLLPQKEYQRLITILEARKEQWKDAKEAV